MSKMFALTILATVTTLSGCARTAIEDEALQQERFDCYRNNGNACETLGERFIDGNGAEVNHAYAEHFLKMGCRRHNNDACGELGWLYLHSQRLDRSAEDGLELLDRACANYSFESCMVLAHELLDPDASYADPERAETILEHLEFMGLPMSCAE